MELGRHAPALLVLEAALAAQGRGTRVAASDHGSPVSLGFSRARVNLASLLPRPVPSTRWERAISPSCIQVFKRLHLDTGSFCTLLFCKVIITLYEPAQAFLSGNVLLAFFFFYHLLHIYLGLVTLKAYILTWLFTKDTEAEIASYEFVTQNQTWTESKREKGFSYKALILSIAVIKSIKSVNLNVREADLLLAFLPFLSFGTIRAHIITILPGSNGQLAGRSFLPYCFPHLLSLWLLPHEISVMDS